jgi:hypothetical protein
MKLIELYPSRKVIIGSKEYELKYTFRSLILLEELLEQISDGNRTGASSYIIESVQADYMPANVMIVFLRAGLYVNDEFMSADEVVAGIDTKLINEYRKAIVRAYSDFFINDEQIKALEEIEKSKKKLMDIMTSHQESLIQNLNYSQPCPESLIGIARLFLARIKENVMRLFSMK